jgi:uncharacterized protein YkwD
MKIRTTCIFMMVCLFVPSAIPAVALEEYLARQILEEINLARAEPLKFAGFLRELRKRFRGKVYQMPGSATLVQTIEGVDAVDEAILFLSHQKPLPPLAWSTELAAAADELIREQGRSGAVGHSEAGSSGIRERSEHHGIWMEWIGESIAYGPNDPRIMVMRLLIDDGTPDRGHRKNQFDPDFANAGVSCGPHPHYGSMCVIDFSGGLLERGLKKRWPI